MRGRSALFGVTVALAAVVTLSGCDQLWGASGGGSGGQPGPGSGAGSETTAPSEPNADGSATECPVGRWRLDNASWQVELARLIGDGSTVTITGTLDLDWESDGTYLLTADSSLYVVEGTSDGTPYTMSILHDGTESGTWAASGEGYLLAATDSDDWGSTVTIEAGGASYTADTEAAPPDPWSGVMTVSCGPTWMTTTATEDGATATVRFDQR